MACFSCKGSEPKAEQRPCIHGDASKQLSPLFHRLAPTVPSFLRFTLTYPFQTGQDTGKQNGSISRQIMVKHGPGLRMHMRAATFISASQVEPGGSQLKPRLIKLELRLFRHNRFLYKASIAKSRIFSLCPRI